MRAKVSTLKNKLVRFERGGGKGKIVEPNLTMHGGIRENRASVALRCGRNIVSDIFVSESCNPFRTVPTFWGLTTWN